MKIILLNVTLIDITDVDWRKDDVAERGRGRVDAGHRPCVDELLRIFDQEIHRRSTNRNLSKVDLLFQNFCS